MIAVMGAAGTSGARWPSWLLEQDLRCGCWSTGAGSRSSAGGAPRSVTGDQIDPGDLGGCSGRRGGPGGAARRVTDPEFAATRSRMSRAIADAPRRVRRRPRPRPQHRRRRQPGPSGPRAGLRELEGRLGSGLGRPQRPGSAVAVLHGEPARRAAAVQAKGINASAIDGDLELPDDRHPRTSPPSRRAAGPRTSGGTRSSCWWGRRDQPAGGNPRPRRRLGCPTLATPSSRRPDCGRADGLRHVRSRGPRPWGAAARPQPAWVVRHVPRRRDVATPTRLAGFLEWSDPMNGFQELRGRFRGGCCRPARRATTRPGASERGHRPAPGPDRPLCRGRRTSP